MGKRDDDNYAVEQRLISLIEDKLHDYGCDSRRSDERNNAERITRLEEQMKTAYHTSERIEDKLDRLIEQGQIQNVNLAQNSVKISTGERLTWLVVSGVVGLLIYYVKAGGVVP